MRGHVRKRGNTWTAVIFVGYDHLGKRKYKWFGGHKTKKEAEKFLAAKIQEINSGSVVEPSKQRVSEYLLDWLKFKETQVRPNTYLGYEGKVRLQIIPHIGHIQLANLRPQHIDEMYAALVNEGLSKRTIVHVHRILHDALTRAVKWGIVPRNAADAVDPPKATQAKMQVWARDEVIRYLRAAESNPYFVFFLLAITTGMRMGEILGLQWADVDFEKEELYVRRMTSRVTGALTEHAPKTERSRRVIALPTETVDLLRKHKLKQTENRLRFGQAYEVSDFIITRDNGIVPHPVSLRDQHGNICKAAAVPYIRVHDMRHTHATLLLEQGVHPKIVSERLGHATIGITLDIYTHILPSLQQKTAKEFGKALFGN